MTTQTHKPAAQKLAAQLSAARDDLPSRACSALAQAAAGAPLRAALYGRVSKDDDKRSRSVPQQIAGNRKAAAAHLWVWDAADEYADPEVSASRFGKKARPQWAALVAGVAAGRYQVVVLWETSRGSRNTDDWQPFISLCGRMNVLIHVASHDRTYDPRPGKDRKLLLDEGTANEDQSEQTSTRVRRHMAAVIESGKPIGNCPYGYRNVYDSATGELESREINPEQAAIVRRIVLAAGRGVPLSTIVDELRADGIPTKNGGQWVRSTVRGIAINPTYIGIRVHHTAATCSATSERTTNCTSCARHRGEWEPIVSDDEHYAAVARVMDPARKTTRDGAVKWMLSYIPTCGKCGSPCQGAPARGASRPNPVYCCTRGCVSMKAAVLDEAIASVFCYELVQLGAYERILHRDMTEPVRAARAEGDRLRGELDEYTALIGTPHALPARLMSETIARLTALIADADRRSVDVAVPEIMRELLGRPGDAYEAVRGRFDAMLPTQRKQALRWCGLAITILPMPSGLCTRDASVKRFTYSWGEVLAA